MPRRIESVLIPGPAGNLEALLEEPDDQDPAQATLVCHPHPQGGGTMHNKVVYRMARGSRKAGCVVLRFNYRGVNLSQGTYDHGNGETDDARAALAWFQARYPNLPFNLAGFSFGSRIALRLGCTLPEIRRVIAVGFPTVYKDRNFIYTCSKKKIFIHSTNDEFGPRVDYEQMYAGIPEPKRLLWITAEDHFFKGALDDLERAIISAYA